MAQERSLRDQGISELRHGDKGRARELLRRATDERPDDADAWLWLAFAEPRRDDQIAALRQLARIAPGHAALDKALASLKLSSADVQPATALPLPVAPSATMEAPAVPPGPPRGDQPTPARPQQQAATGTAAERQPDAVSAPPVTTPLNQAQQLKCPRCGTPFLGGAEFCSRCGLNLRNPQQLPPAAPVGAPPRRKRGKALPIVLIIVLLMGGAVAAILFTPAGDAVSFSVKPLCAFKASGYIEEKDALLRRWTDAVELADSTSRMALPAQIQRLQELRQEAEQMDAPACVEAAHRHLLSAMRGTERTFIAFVSQEDDLVVEALIKDAATSMNLYNAALFKATGE